MVEKEKSVVVKGFRVVEVATSTEQRLLNEDGEPLSDREALVLILDRLDRLVGGLL